MNFIQFWNDYWYILIMGIALLLLYLHYSKNKTIGNLNNSDLGLLIEIGFYILIIITVQDILFSSHVFWIIPFFIFIPFWSGIIWVILNRGNYYLIESRMQGQEFFKLGLIPDDKEISKEITLETGIRLHIMDKDIFESKNHFGDDFSPRYNAGDKVKHCDYFDGNTIYHPEYPDLKNLSFWARVVEFVSLKKLVPDLMRTNLVLTDLSNVRIYKAISDMRDNLKTTLTGLEKQYEPYSIENEIKKLLEEQIKQKHEGLSESETKESIQNKEAGDISNDG